MESIKVNEGRIVGAVICFLASFAIAMWGAWALRMSGWWDFPVILYTVIAVLALLGFTGWLAHGAFAKDKS